MGTTNSSFTNANRVQIAVTHQAFSTISLMYIEKYVSVPRPRHNIKSAKDKEIDLIFTGIFFLISLITFFVFLGIGTSF